MNDEDREKKDKCGCMKEEEIIHERGRRRTSQYATFYAFASSSSFFFPSLIRSCAFRRGLTKLINVNLLT